MTDLHQGVTAGTHDVLDFLDKRRERWSDEHTLGAQLNEARDFAARAHGGFITERPLAEIRAEVVEAAARLIDALGEIDRCLAAGDA